MCRVLDMVYAGVSRSSRREDASCQALLIPYRYRPATAKQERFAVVAVQEGAVAMRSSQQDSASYAFDYDRATLPLP